MKRVAVIGGGITGLAAAHRLNELAPETEVHLFESTSRLGGVLHTESVQDYLVEHSADMFTTKDVAALNLCQRIGLADELINTNSKFQRAFIAQDNQLVPVPRGLNLMTPSDLDAIRNSPLLSEAGKQRFLQEEFIEPAQGLSDESLKDFATRRFGQEAFDKIIQPLVGGIYTADPAKLSLRSTLPQYLEMEARFGSVIGAAKASSAQADQKNQATSGARYHLFVAPRNGMASLVESLRNHLTNTQIHMEQSATTLNRLAEGWQLVNQAGTSQDFDGVIITCPSNIAARMIRTASGELSQMLETIEFASSAIVIHGFNRQQIDHELNGFGFVVPLSQNRNILAGSFSSVKFDGRCSDDKLLSRTFVGGGCQAELLENDDAQIAEMARQDLAELLGISGAPELTKVVRWNHSMPQYHLGHNNLISDIEKAVKGIDALEIAGKCFRGVGIPACIASGEDAAERLVR